MFDDARAPAAAGYEHELLCDCWRTRAAIARCQALEQQLQRRLRRCDKPGCLNDTPFTACRECTPTAVRLAELDQELAELEASHRHIARQLAGLTTEVRR